MLVCEFCADFLVVCDHLLFTCFFASLLGDIAITVVWKYPSMQKIATLTGHTYRVLYLAVRLLVLLPFFIVLYLLVAFYSHLLGLSFSVQHTTLPAQLSPDGSTIVTGAGDETLRFWQVFPGPQKENKAGGLLFPAGMPGSVIR